MWIIQETYAKANLAVTGLVLEIKDKMLFAFIVNIKLYKLLRKMAKNINVESEAAPLP